MPPEGIALFIGAMTVILGTFRLLGMRMRLRADRDRPTIAPDEFDRLTESVDHLTEQLGALAIETADLQERIDFTERLLTEARREPVDTPV